MPTATYFGAVESLYHLRLNIQDEADSIVGSLYHCGDSVGSMALLVGYLLILTSTASVSTLVNLIYYCPYCGQLFHLSTLDVPIGD